LNIVGLSPAHELVRRTYPPFAAVPLYCALAAFEVGLGVLLLAGLGGAGLPPRRWRIGFISFSSCSFASLAATRTVITKGAHPANAVAFMVATTNLVIELGIVLWVLVGWKFVLANFVLGIIMIAYVYVLMLLVDHRVLGEGPAALVRAATARLDGLPIS